MKVDLDKRGEGRVNLGSINEEKHKEIENKRATSRYMCMKL
jgi:hypothetical protein